MKHIHHDCIVAWANGALIQVQEKDNLWIDCENNFPQWNSQNNYRIKPEEKKKVILNAWLTSNGFLLYNNHPKKGHNINTNCHIRIPELDKEIEI